MMTLNSMKAASGRTSPWPALSQHPSASGSDGAVKIGAGTGTLQRPLVKRTSRDVFISEPGPANVTMFVFCVTGTTPGAPLEVFDAQLAMRGITAIYLCDLDGLAFIKGVKSLGGTRDALFSHMQTLAGQRPKEKIVTIGFSRTVITAVASALVLKADGVISFGGVTSATPAFRKQIGDDRNPELAAKAFALGGADLDLHTWFDRYDHRPVIQMHFAPKKRIDKAQAMGIADIENVALHPWPDHTDHNLAGEMLERGTFGQTIDMMLAAI